jgi:hypothetical protein
LCSLSLAPLAACHPPRTPSPSPPHQSPLATRTHVHVAPASSWMGPLAFLPAPLPLVFPQACLPHVFFLFFSRSLLAPHTPLPLPSFAQPMWPGPLFVSTCNLPFVAPGGRTESTWTRCVRTRMVACAPPLFFCLARGGYWKNVHARLIPALSPSLPPTEPIPAIGLLGCILLSVGCCKGRRGLGLWFAGLSGCFFLPLAEPPWGWFRRLDGFVGESLLQSLITRALAPDGTSVGACVIPHGHGHGLGALGLGVGWGLGLCIGCLPRPGLGSVCLQAPATFPNVRDPTARLPSSPTRFIQRLL